MPAPKIPPRFEVFQTADGQWSYRIVHGNGRKATASETYTRRSTAKRMAENLREALRLSWAEVVVVE